MIRLKKKEHLSRLVIKIMVTIVLILGIAGIKADIKNTYCMETTPNTNFEIKGTVLKKYSGTDSVVTIPQGITKIGKEAFLNNQAVVKVIIPEGVVQIEQGAFYKCTNLKVVSLPNSLNRLGSYAFARCPKISKLVLPDSLTIIESNAFYNMESLKRITLPKSLVNAPNIFGKVSYIQNVKFAPGTKVIPEYVLRNATTLESVTIPSGVTVISRKAFQNCSSLAKIKLPNSVIRVGRHAFQNCISLGLVKMGKKEITFEKDAFLGAVKVYFQGYNHSTAKSYAKANQIKFKYVASEVERMKKQKSVYKSFKSKIVKKKNRNYRIPELKNGYIPQGLCEIGNYFVISAYKEYGTDYSVLFLVDKKTGKYKKKIVLPVVEHVGGLATVKNRVLVPCSGGGYVGILTRKDIETAKNGEQLSFQQKIRTGKIGSFATYDGTYFWVGKYNQLSNGVMYGYKVKEVKKKKKIKKKVKKTLEDGTTVIKTKVKTKTIKKLELKKQYSLEIPKQIQGVTVMANHKNGNKTFVFSQSSGRNRNSSLLIFRKVTLSKKRTVVLTKANKTITIPPMAEGILKGKNGYLYILFESGANMYSSNVNHYCETPIYRMCYIKLNKLY